MSSTPGSSRDPGEGYSNPPQYSGLGNPMDRGAWWVTVHGVAKGQAQLRLNSNKYGYDEEVSLIFLCILVICAKTETFKCNFLVIKA